MKKYVYIIGIFLIAIMQGKLFGQAPGIPDLVNYQAVARDASGTVMANKSLKVKIRIVKGQAPSTSVVYEEEHSVVTNSYGQFSLKINGAAGTPDFSSIKWSSDIHSLQVLVDTGSGYVDLGTSQLVSVPYAFESKKATKMSINDLTDVGALSPAQGQVLKWNNSLKQWEPKDDQTGGGGSSYTAGSGISISGGNVIANTGDTNAADDILTTTTAGGDIGGTFSNLSVNRIRGRAVANTAPTSGQILKWNGTQWAPGADKSGIALPLDMSSAEQFPFTIRSTHSTGVAIQGVSPGTAVVGTSTNYIGVYGFAEGTCDLCHGIVGRTNSTTANAGLFYGKVAVQFLSGLQDPQLWLKDTGNNYARLSFSNGTGNSFWTIAGYNSPVNDQEKMNFYNSTSGDILTLTGNGKVGIHNTNPISDLMIKQSIWSGAGGITIENFGNTNQWNMRMSDNNNFWFAYNNANKAYINFSTGAYTVFSDRRLKKDIAPLSNLLGRITQLSPATFRFTSDHVANSPKSYGFIAQEVEKIFPELVKPAGDGYKSIAYDDFAVLAIEGIKEQQEIINALEARIQQLETLLNQQGSVKKEPADNR